MKYKTQDDTPKNNPYLEDIIDLLVLNKQFMYAIDSENKKKECYKMGSYVNRLHCNHDSLIKLATSLNSEHVEPTYTVEFSPIESAKDLKDYEEKYYNMLKEIAENAMEDKEVEVVAYLFDMIRKFEHYFCTLNEDNVSRETSSE